MLSKCLGVRSCWWGVQFEGSRQDLMFRWAHLWRNLDSHKQETNRSNFFRFGCINIAPGTRQQLSHHKLSRSCSGSICCLFYSVFQKNFLKWNHNHANNTDIKITDTKFQVSTLLMYVFCLYPRNVDSKGEAVNVFTALLPYTFKACKKM